MLVSLVNVGVVWVYQERSNVINEITTSTTKLRSFLINGVSYAYWERSASHAGFKGLSAE